MPNAGDEQKHRIGLDMALDNYTESGGPVEQSHATKREVYPRRPVQCKPQVKFESLAHTTHF